MATSATTTPQSAYVFTPAPFWFAMHFMLVHGHQAPELLRVRFAAVLLSFADLDSYPRRAELEAAFAPGGSFRARCTEAAALARAGYLDEQDYRHCADSAADLDDGWTDEAAAALIVRAAH